MHATRRAFLTTLPLLGLFLAAAPATRPAARPASRPTAPSRAPAPAPAPVAEQDPDRPPVAKRIVFICVLGKESPPAKVAALKAELSKAIGALNLIQSFNVIFPAEKGVRSFSPGGKLIPANPDNRRKAQAFLGTVTFPAKPDPLPAITTAFAGKPDFVYLLTGRDFPDNAAVVKKIAELNGDKPVKVNTILMGSEGEGYSETAEDALREIAEASGGSFRFVTDEDLKEQDDEKK